MNSTLFLLPNTHTVLGVIGKNLIFGNGDSCPIYPPYVPPSALVPVCVSYQVAFPSPTVAVWRSGILTVGDYSQPVSVALAEDDKFLAIVGRTPDEKPFVVDSQFIRDLYAAFCEDACNDNA